MRYSTALVLSTFAVGQAAAHSIRHASFHARRQPDVKAREEVDYSKVDYSNVNWASINWASVFDLKNKQPSPTPAPAPPVVEVAKVPEPTPEAAYTPPPAPSSTKEEQPKKTEASENPVEEFFEGVLEGLTDGIEDFCKKKKISSPGKNSKTPSTTGLWLGESKWAANFNNGGNDDVWVVCWVEGGFTGMTINVNQPDILIKIPVGKNQTVSFPEKVAAACAPMYPDTELALFGGVKNPWFEANFGPTDSNNEFVGTFDVSKNVNMKGDIIEAHGSKCVSNMNQCVFECKDKSVDSCEFGYELVNCDSSNGGGQGYDAVMQGVGGGCNMAADSERIEVTFRNKGY